MASHRGTVLVTGASGYIGSYLVHRLLERGYIVRATVRNPDDDRCTKPIYENLQSELAQNLQIFKANLLLDGDFDAAVDGCEGVFHLASPVKSVMEDYKRDMIDPAMNGTLNVLKSCIKSGTVKRFVHTSTTSAMLAPRVLIDESCWTDVDLLIEKQPFLGWEYCVSKVFSERAATEFAKEHDLDMVVINPSFVVGPFKVSQIPLSMIVWLLPLLHKDAVTPLDIRSLPCVHIEDLCRAYIFLYENPDAKGRHICSAEYVPLSVIADIARSKHPDINFYFKGSEEDTQGGQYVGFDSTKLKGLGFEYWYNIEKMIDDFITCCKQKGLLQELLPQ